MGEPTTIRAGDSISWDRSLPDYSAADGWSVSYRLLGVAGAYTINATGAGNDYSVNLAAPATALYLQGDYSLTGWATKGADAELQRATIYSGRCTILPNLAPETLKSSDPRSATEIELAAARAAWAANAKSYSIGDRTVTYQDNDQMLVRIRFLEQELVRLKAAQQLASGLGMPPGRIQVRM